VPFTPALIITRGGGVRSAPVGRVNERKKTGMHIALARTRGKKAQVYLYAEQSYIDSNI